MFFVMNAGKKRTCTVCKGSIKKGEVFLGFKKGSGIYTVTGNVCRLCFDKFVGEMALLASEDNVLELKNLKGGM